MQQSLIHNNLLKIYRHKSHLNPVEKGSTKVPCFDRKWHPNDNFKKETYVCSKLKD